MESLNESIGCRPTVSGRLKKRQPGGNGGTWWRRDSKGRDKRLKKGSGNCWPGTLFHKVSGVEGRVLWS